jgi:cytochrome P450
MTATEPARPAIPAAPRRVARPAGRMPGPSPRMLPSLLVKLWRDRLSLLSDAADEFGDAVLMRMGPKSIYFFNHPDHAKHVLADNPLNFRKGMGLAEAKRILGDGLLTSEGDLWRRQRKTIQPAFRRDRIAAFADVVVGEAGQLIDSLGRRPPGAAVDVMTEMTRLTLRILGKTLLDADLAQFGGLGPAFEAVQDQAMFEMVTLRALPIWLPLPKHRRFAVARDQLEDIAMALVSQRERDLSPGGEDMISRLLDAYRTEPQASLRHRRLKDELLTILLAGHETTASTLSWTWYLIDRHPEVAARMHDEAVAVLGDRPPRYEDLRDLRYTTMVIQEAMRLYPPVWGLTRVALEADEVGGYRVPAGADVMISPYTLHRHPGFWPEPDRFDPERFDPAAPGPEHRYAYIPFGAGPRVCVGSHLGMMEATFVAAMVARKFRLRLRPGYLVRPEAMLSLRVHGGLPMLVDQVGS